jgi:hypothetical protein
MRSLEQLNAVCTINLRFDPKKRPQVSIMIEAKNGVALKVEGHLGSAFLVHEGNFFFLSYGPYSPGSYIDAYDLSNGKKLWSSAELSHFGPFGHSGYGNSAHMRFSRGGEVDGEKRDDSIVVRGRESFGDYITIVSRETGDVIANRAYRTDFAKVPTGE